MFLPIHISIQSIFLSNPYFNLIHISIQSIFLSNPYFYPIHISIQSIFLSNPYFYSIHTSIQSIFLSNPYSYLIQVLIQSIFLSNHCFNIIQFSLKIHYFIKFQPCNPIIVLIQSIFSSIHISIKSIIFLNSYFSLICVSIVISVVLAYQQFYDFYYYNSRMVYQDGIIQHTSLVSSFSPRLDKLNVFNPVLIYLNFIWTSLFNPSSLIQSLK